MHGCPQAGGNSRNRKIIVGEKFSYFAELYNMTKGLQDRKEYEIPNQFFVEIFYVNLRFLRKMSNINWFFAQTRKILQLGFLISFRIINDFQAINLHLFLN